MIKIKVPFCWHLSVSLLVIVGLFCEKGLTGVPYEVSAEVFIEKASDALFARVQAIQDRKYQAIQAINEPLLGLSSYLVQYGSVDTDLAPLLHEITKQGGLLHVLSGFIEAGLEQAFIREQIIQFKRETLPAIIRRCIGSGMYGLNYLETIGALDSFTKTLQYKPSWHSINEQGARYRERFDEQALMQRTHEAHLREAERRKQLFMKQERERRFIEEQQKRELEDRLRSEALMRSKHEQQTRLEEMQRLDDERQHDQSTPEKVRAAYRFIGVREGIGMRALKSAFDLASDKAHADRNIQRAVDLTNAYKLILNYQKNNQPQLSGAAKIPSEQRIKRQSSRGKLTDRLGGKAGPRGRGLRRLQEQRGSFIEDRRFMGRPS